MKQQVKFITYVTSFLLILSLSSILLFKFLILEPFEDNTYTKFKRNSDTAFQLIENFIEESIKLQLKQIVYSFKSSIEYHLKKNNSTNVKQILPLINHMIQNNKVAHQGYLYITNANGIILAHPDKTLVGKKSLFYKEYQKSDHFDDLFKKYRFKATNKFLYKTYLRKYNIFITVSIPKIDFNSFMDTKNLRRILAPLNTHSIVYFYLVDANGKILIHKNSKKEGHLIFSHIKDRLNSFSYYGKNISFQKEEVQNRTLKQFKKIFNLLKVDKKGFFSYSLKNKKNPYRFAYFYYITDINQFIISAFKPNLYLEPLWKTFYFISAIIFMLSLLMITFIYKHLKNKINHLKQLNSKIGNFIAQEISDNNIVCEDLDEVDKFKAYMQKLTGIFKANSTFFHQKENENLQKIQAKALLIEEQKQKQEKDFIFAKRIQQKILPLMLPFVQGVKIAHLFHQEKDLSSSFYDFIRFREESKIGFFLSKLSGEGIPLVLMNSVLKTLLLNSGSHKLSPKELFFYLNDKIKKEFTSQEHFLSSLYCLFDQKKSTIRFAKASFPSPILLRNNQFIEIEDFSANQKYLNNFLLGVLENKQIDFKETEVSVQKKDRIFLFSDTLLKIKNKENQSFQTVLNSHILKTASLPLQKALDQIFQNLLMFSKPDKLHTDICLIALEIL